MEFLIKIVVRFFSVLLIISIYSAFGLILGLLIDLLSPYFKLIPVISGSEVRASLVLSAVFLVFGVFAAVAQVYSWRISDKIENLVEIVLATYISSEESFLPTLSAIERERINSLFGYVDDGLSSPIKSLLLGRFLTLSEIQSFFPMENRKRLKKVLVEQEQYVKDRVSKIALSQS